MVGIKTERTETLKGRGDESISNSETVERRGE